ncbi:MAG: ankyrin repeat domain-containing protein [Holosporales bacterium]|jgi:ankyrin repeat protein|nr:ankyrin repeat domain-containing protein [Holosporales bacterium]
MKEFYKATALVSLLGLGISNLFCGESAGVQEGYEAEARRRTEEVEAAQRQEIDQLFAAVERGYCGEVEELILKSENKKALVNARDVFGWTPLHNAASGGNLEIVKVLLEAGANKDAIYNSYYGITPLHGAAFRGHTKVVKVLLKAGADKDAKGNDGCTPLHRAASEGQVEVVKVLLAAGANKDAKDDYGWTPLHIAVSRGYTEVAEVLLAFGADKEARDGGDAPLHYARSEELKRLLS